MRTAYYHIKDLNLLGKEEDYVPYVYTPGKGWVVDKDHILMDRIMGYDEFEPADSPYKIGNTSILESIEEISEKEAEKFIADM